MARHDWLFPNVCGLLLGACACTPALAATPHLLHAQDGQDLRMDEHGWVAQATATAATRVQSVAGSTPTWHALGPPGGDVSDVVASPTAAGVVLAGVAPNGSVGGTLFRSTDDAASWTAVADFANLSVHRLAFADDGTAYAAAQSRLWKSTDDGASWTQLDYAMQNPNDETFAVTIDPSAQTTLWVGLTAALGQQPINLMRSTDGGATWEDRTPPHDAPILCDGIAIDPHDSNTVIAIFRGDFGGGEIWVTTDGGDTWQNRSDGLPANPMNAVRYDGTRLLVGGGQSFGQQDFGLYQSTDLGVTWTPLHDTTWPSLVVTDVAVDAADAQKILVATDGAGINRSTDGGATWTVSVPGSGALAARSVRFGAGDEIYAGASSLAVYKSTDDGQSFAQSANGISLLSLYAIAVSPIDAQQIAVAFQGQNNGGVYRSADGGTTWALEDVPPTRYSKVGFAPDGTLYAISSGPSTIAPEGLYRRASDGSWTGLGPDQGPNFESDLSALRFSVNDANRILLGGADFGTAGFGSTVWRSLDAGASWTKVFLGDDNDKVSDIEIVEDGTDQNAVAVYDGFTQGQQGGALRSVDGGASWTPALDGLPAFARIPRLCETPGATPAIFLSAATDASHGAVFRTDDAGASWTPTGSAGPAIADIACDPSDASTLYIAQAGNDRVARSTDAGAHFVAFADGLEGSATPTDLAVTHVDGGTRLFLATLSGSYTATATSDVIFRDGFDGTP